VGRRRVGESRERGEDFFNEEEEEEEEEEE